MKYSKTALKELTAKYRDILRKCAYLNAAILLSVALSSPAGADPTPVADWAGLQAALLNSEISDIAVTDNITATEGEDFWVSGSKTIALDGHTIDGADVNRQISVRDGAQKVTLTGGGTVSNLNYENIEPGNSQGGNIFVAVKSELALENGDYTFKDNENGFGVINVNNNHTDGTTKLTTSDVGTLTFKDNTGHGQGAALYITGNATKPTEVSLNAEKIVFDGNKIASDSITGHGGAVMNMGLNTSLVADTVEFTSNKVLADKSGLATDVVKSGGGAIQNAYDGDLTVGKVGGTVKFADNSSTTNGGALLNRGASLTKLNGTVTFDNNHADINGGAVYNTSSKEQTITNATFTKNSADEKGGAIYNDGTLTLTNAVFGGAGEGQGNKATGQGGAIYTAGNMDITGTKFDSNTSAEGGAMFIRAEDKTVKIKNSSFTNNSLTAEDVGGAITLARGTLDIDNTVFSGNNAAWSGAIFTYSAGNTLKVKNSQFLNNTALGAGAVQTMFNAEISDTLFEGNKATADEDGAGALFVGAVGKAELNNVTFNDNEAAYGGGAIATRKANLADNSEAKLDILNSTFTNNTAGTTGGALDNYLYSSKADDVAVYISKTSFDKNEAAQGGAIYNHGESDYAGNQASLKVVDSNFTNNIATTAGGAIYNMAGGGMTVAAETRDVVFSGNKANGIDNDIYNSGNLTLNAADGRTLTLNGGIDGTAGNLKVTGDGTGTVKLSSVLKNQTAVVSSGELWLAEGSSLSDSTISVASGATINTMDNEINNYTGKIALGDGALIKGDIDFLNEKADQYDATGTVKYKVGNLLNIGQGEKLIQVASDGSTVDIGGAVFTSDVGASFASSGEADGKMKITGMTGGIDKAAENSGKVTETEYTQTADETVSADTQFKNQASIDGNGHTLELDGVSFGAGDGAELEMSNVSLTGTGTYVNAATARTKVLNSSFGVKVFNAGLWESDPTSYDALVTNTGVFSVDGDTFTGTGILDNYNIANFKQDGTNKPTFEDGSKITGSGVVNLVSGETVFGSSAAITNTNTVKVATGADFSGALTGGTLDLHNGSIDTIAGSYSGGTVTLDAKLGATNTIDTVAGDGVITEINILGTDYGTTDKVVLDIGDATLDPNLQINGMNYYTKVEKVADSTDPDYGKLRLSDKLINQTALEDALDGITEIKSGVEGNGAHVAVDSATKKKAELSADETVGGEMFSAGVNANATSKQVEMAAEYYADATDTDTLTNSAVVRTRIDNSDPSNVVSAVDVVADNISLNGATTVNGNTTITGTLTAGATTVSTLAVGTSTAMTGVDATDGTGKTTLATVATVNGKIADNNAVLLGNASVDGSIAKAIGGTGTETLTKQIQDLADGQITAATSTNATATDGDAKLTTGDQVYESIKAQAELGSYTGKLVDGTTSTGDIKTALNGTNVQVKTNTTNIGTLGSLTTDAKTNLVAAINEVDSHADAISDVIGAGTFGPGAGEINGTAGTLVGQTIGDGTSGTITVTQALANLNATNVSQNGTLGTIGSKFDGSVVNAATGAITTAGTALDATQADGTTAATNVVQAVNASSTINQAQNTSLSGLASLIDGGSVAATGVRTAGTALTTGANGANVVAATNTLSTLVNTNGTDSLANVSRSYAGTLIDNTKSVVYNVNNLATVLKEDEQKIIDLANNSLNKDTAATGAYSSANTYDAGTIGAAIKHLDTEMGNVDNLFTAGAGNIGRGDSVAAILSSVDTELDAATAKNTTQDTQLNTLATEIGGTYDGSGKFTHTAFTSTNNISATAPITTAISSLDDKLGDVATARASIGATSADLAGIVTEVNSKFTSGTVDAKFANTTVTSLAINGTTYGITSTGDASFATVDAKNGVTVGKANALTSTVAGKLDMGANDLTNVGAISAASLTTTGDATIGGGVTVGKANALTSTVTGTLDMGANDLTNIKTLTTTGDATIGRDLDVTRDLTVGGDLDVTGDISGATLTTTGDATVGGDLNVTGDISGATLTTTGDATVGGDLNVTGDISGATLTTTGDATIGGGVTVGKANALTSTVTGTLDMGANDLTNIKTLTTTGDATVGGDLSVTGDISGKDVTASGNLAVTGTTTLTGALTANGDVTLGDAAADTVTVNGKTVLNSTLQFGTAAGTPTVSSIDATGADITAGTATALVTGAAVKAKAEDADYTTVGSNITAATTIGTAINTLDTVVGKVSTLNVGTGPKGDAITKGSGVAAASLVEATNNIDETLGKIHGLAAASTLGANSNLDGGAITTVGNHLVALDNAIGDQTQYAGGKFVKSATNTADAVMALDQNMYNMNQDVKRLDKEMRGGFASMAAMSALVPNARAAGNTQIAVGAGAYRDHQGMAIGAFHYFNDNVLANMGLSYGGDKSTVFRAGVTFGW